MFAQAMVQHAVTNATRTRAYMHFEELRLQGLRCQFWARITGGGQALLNLYAVQKQLTVHTRTYAGIRLVPINRIHGSEGRVGDFDTAFRPLKPQSLDRWVSIVVAQETGVGLPAVELVQIQDVYFVRDGHHRISVARWLGQREIEAQVTVWQVNATSIPALQPKVTGPGAWVKQWALTRFYAWLTMAGKWLAASGKQRSSLVQTEL